MLKQRINFFRHRGFRLLTRNRVMMSIPHGTLESTFEGTKGNAIDMVHKPGEAPYLMTRSHGKNGHIWQVLRWDVNAHPYLALRMRQPQLQEGGDFSVRLRLSTTGEHVVIPISGNTEHPHVLKHDTPIQWTAGEWYSLIINVAAAVRQAAGDKADDVRINQIEIQRNHENKNDLLIGFAESIENKQIFMNETSLTF